MSKVRLFATDLDIFDKIWILQYFILQPHYEKPPTFYIRTKIETGQIWLITSENRH